MRHQCQSFVKTLKNLLDIKSLSYFFENVLYLCKRRKTNNCANFVLK